MTWTKLGAEFSDDAANVDLSDAAFRTHVEAIQWLYTVERTDCHVPARLVQRFAGSPHFQAAIDELVAQGWWCIDQQGYTVVHHGDIIRASVVTQQKKRDRSKETSKRHREKRAAESESDTSRDTSRSQSDRQPASTASESSSWPEVMVRGGGPP